jgi:hypothetical protein
VDEQGEREIPLSEHPRNFLHVPTNCFFAGIVFRAVGLNLNRASIRKKVKMVPGHGVTEAHTFVASLVYLGCTLRGGVRRGRCGRLAYSVQGKAREGDRADERLFHEDGIRTIHASDHVSQRLRADSSRPMMIGLQVPPVTTLMVAVKKNAATKQSKATVLTHPRVAKLAARFQFAATYDGLIIRDGFRNFEAEGVISVERAGGDPVFRRGRLSGNPEFHLGPAEKGTGAPPPCLEVLPGLRSLCVCGLSDPEIRGSFLLRCHKR